MNSSIFHIPITETPSMVSTNNQWNSQNESLEPIFVPLDLLVIINPYTDNLVIFDHFDPSCMLYLSLFPLFYEKIKIT